MGLPVTNTLSGIRSLFSVTYPGQPAVPLAYASGVNGSEEISYEPVETLDNPEVREWVPTGYRVSLSANMFRTFEKSGVRGTGSLKVQGLFPKQRDILTHLPMTAAIVDGKSNGKRIMLYEKVNIASYSFSIVARGLVGMDVQFVCVRAKDESEQGNITP